MHLSPAVNQLRVHRVVVRLGLVPTTQACGSSRASRNATRPWCRRCVELQQAKASTSLCWVISTRQIVDLRWLSEPHSAIGESHFLLRRVPWSLGQLLQLSSSLFSWHVRTCAYAAFALLKQFFSSNRAVAGEQCSERSSTAKMISFFFSNRAVAWEQCSGRSSTAKTSSFFC